MQLKENERLIDGKVEELVKVSCDNEQGFYITYKSAMREGEVLFDVAPTETKAQAPWLATTSKSKKQASA